MISPAILAGVLLCSVVYIFYYFQAKLRKYKDVNKLPGAPPLQLLWQAVGPQSCYEKFQYISSLNKKYGPVIKLWIKPFDPIIMVADIDLMNKMLISKEHIAKTKMYDLMKPYIGDSIGTINEVEKWKKCRKMCNPAFHLTTISGFLPVFKKYGETFLELIRSEEGRPIDVQRKIPLYALDIIFESFWRQHQDFHKNQNGAFIDAYEDFFSILSTRLYSIILSNDFFFRFSKYFKRMEKAVTTIRGHTYTIIETEKARRENGGMSSTRQLVDILFANNLDEKAINDNMNSFIVGGHDTVAHAMSFIMYELSKRLEIQQRLYKEIISIVGRDPSAEITHGHLQAMTYLEAVLKESLRLYNIVPIIERIAGSDVEFNGIHYPKGTRFMFNIDAIHKSNQYFTHPEKFDPNRFMPDSGYGDQKNAFVPFSVGPRDCIGKLYAMLEMKCIIAKCVHTFELIPVEDHSLKLVNEIVLRSISGTPVIFKERVKM